MSPDQLALLRATHLSRAARLMGLWLSTRDDWTEVPRDVWRRFLGRGSRGLATKDAIASYLGELEVDGWLERKRGGRAHPDSFRFKRPPEADAKNKRPLEADPKKDRVSHSLTPSDLASTTAGRLNHTTATTDYDCYYVLTEAAEKVVAQDIFRGCRGALRDYLKLRVPERSQLGYVQRIAQALNGSDSSFWKYRTGASLPDKGRAALLAAALNELASGDEIGEHFPNRPGSFGNLRTKVRHEVAIRMGQDQDTEETRHGRGGNQDAGGSSRADRKEAGRTGRPSGQGAYRHE